MDFHISRIQKAKKPYRCCSTGAWIKPGDQYYYHVGVYEGDFGVDRMHSEIYKIYQKINEDYYKNNQESMYFDSILDYLSNNKTFVYNYYGMKKKNKNFLRDLGYARRIAKLDGVPEWFRNKFTISSNKY